MLEFNTQQHVARLNLYDNRHLSVLRGEMRDISHDFERKSKELAPWDEGTLGRSGQSRSSVRPGRAEATVTYSTPYAVKTHEDMDPAPGATMRKGPITLAKPGNEYGPAGGYYVKRVLLGRTPLWMRSIASSIRRIR